VIAARAGGPGGQVECFDVTENEQHPRTTILENLRRGAPPIYLMRWRRQGHAHQSPKTIAQRAELCRRASQSRCFVVQGRRAEPGFLVNEIAPAGTPISGHWDAGTAPSISQFRAAHPRHLPDGRSASPVRPRPGPP